MSRTINVVRLQLVNKMTYVWIPLLVLGASFLIALAIYAILYSSGVEGPYYGGGAQAPLWYFGVVGIQALTLTFPFSQAMSVTRREFYLGTLLTAMLTSLILAVIFVIGGLIERLTDGWGVNGWFFGLPWIWEAGPAGAGLFFFSTALLVFVIGFWCATVYKRFGSIGLTILLVGLGALFVLGLFLVGQANAWGTVFRWFAEQGAVGLSLWGLVVVVVLGAVSYGTLRRAVP